jgi:hypothetical protein
MPWMSVGINFGVAAVGHLSSPPVFSWDRVTQSLALYVMVNFIHMI